MTNERVDQYLILAIACLNLVYRWLAIRDKRRERAARERDHSEYVVRKVDWETLHDRVASLERYKSSKLGVDK